MIVVLIHARRRLVGVTKPWSSSPPQKEGAAKAGTVERTREVIDRPIGTVRWKLAHMIEETGRHAGHADIVRELIDGSTGR
ncbi:DUF664 domain-containing protein [Lentzea sp. NPDC003310]|uniref:mycothiol transferase n=1 Tax=Lentzea sp. NPDC003310 TaxID=3154447 RepID=UPI0033A9CCAE